MSDNMTIGSLFAGIGGLELGLERATGARTIWQIEQDPYARRVLAKHWPQADRSITDVREAGAHNLARPDIICGGFPCQDISLAGAGAGIEGERSGLWGEFARLIGELRPRYAVMENVSAITSRGLDRVLGDLATLGYDAVWDCIPAAAVGAPHRRDRWFGIAYAKSPGCEARPGHRLGDQPGPGIRSTAYPGGQGLAHTDSGRLEVQRQPQHGEQQGPRGNQPDGCGERGRGQGADLAHAAGERRGEGREWLPGSNSSDRSRKGTLGRNAPKGTEMAHANGSRLEEREELRRTVRPKLPPTFGACGTWSGEWWETQPSMGRGSDGLPDGLDGSGVAPWEEGISRTVETSPPHRVARLRCLGNAVVPQVAEVIGGVINRINDHKWGQS